MPEITRVCNTCDVEKPLDAFRIHKTYRGSKRYEHRARKCRQCQQVDHDRWLATNPDRHERYNRANQVRRYGITPLEYSERLERQGGGCKICGRAGGVRNLAIDHDHVTGDIRGLLCSNCNVGLGNFRDDPDLLRRAIAYLGGE